MEQGGIRSYRIPLGLSSVWPRFGDPLNWSFFDYQVALAAQHKMSVLPIIYSTPSWLAGDAKTMPIHTAPQRATWSAFLREAVKRYGPHGGFWKLHPTLPYVPIRAWQIWNEENSIWFTEPVSVPDYASLLKLSSKAIRAADPGATVVAGGLFGKRWLPKTLSAVSFLKRLYKVKGIKSSFDVVALHPYAYNFQDLRTLVVGIRSIMKKARDGRTPLWLTEFGWGSGNDLTNGHDKGPQGQRKQLVARLQDADRPPAPMEDRQDLLVHLERRYQPRHLLLLRQLRLVHDGWQGEAGLVRLRRDHPRQAVAVPRCRRTDSLPAGRPAC